MAVQVGWLFSLIRSGSSATAYAAAAPWGLPVGDEVLGPWVRTDKVYRFPKEQADLVHAFKAAGHRLNPEVVGIAERLFELMGAETGRVISKCPHLMFTPEEFAKWFPTHRAVYLIRHPIHRLNSHFLKGWEKFIERDHDLKVYKTFLARWKGAEHRVVFDDLKAGGERAREFFAACYRGWGWEYTAEDLEKAEAYRAGHYHSAAKNVSEGVDPSRPESERMGGGDRLPEDMLRAYLEDPEIRAFMEEQGWETRPGAYRPGLVKRAVVKVGGAVRRIVGSG